MERELLLLGLLRQADMHGYRLIEFIERDLSICTDMKKSTAYFLLDKMAKQGWVEQRSEQEGNRPPRRVYQITQAGEEQFRRLLRENLATHQAATFAGDIGLAFLDALERAEVLQLLEQRQKALAAEGEKFRAIPQHAGPWQLIIQHRMAHLEAELAWLSSALTQLEE